MPRRLLCCAVTALLLLLSACSSDNDAAVVDGVEDIPLGLRTAGDSVLATVPTCIDSASSIKLRDGEGAYLWAVEAAGATGNVVPSAEVPRAFVVGDPIPGFEVTTPLAGPLPADEELILFLNLGTGSVFTIDSLPIGDEVLVGDEVMSEAEFDSRDWCAGVVDTTDATTGGSSPTSSEGTGGSVGRTDTSTTTTSTGRTSDVGTDPTSTTTP